MARKWRHWFRVFHRDIGYAAVALILAYGISGLAVNHLDDWNPSYSYEQRAIDIGALAGPLPDMAAAVIDRLHIDKASVRGHYLESATDLRVFFEDGQEARVDTRTGRGSLKLVSRRKGLFEVNSLHLNNLKGWWTYVADVFAVALIVLAITGMTMMKGVRGFGGRGKYFVGAGLLLPIAGVVYMYSS